MWLNDIKFDVLRCVVMNSNATFLLKGKLKSLAWCDGALSTRLDCIISWCYFTKCLSACVFVYLQYGTSLCNIVLQNLNILHYLIYCCVRFCACIVFIFLATTLNLIRFEWFQVFIHNVFIFNANFMMIENRATNK